MSNHTVQLRAGVVNRPTGESSNKNHCSRTKTLFIKSVPVTVSSELSCDSLNFQRSGNFICRTKIDENNRVEMQLEPLFYILLPKFSNHARAGSGHRKVPLPLSTSCIRFCPVRNAGRNRGLGRPAHCMNTVCFSATYTVVTYSSSVTHCKSRERTVR